MCILTDFLCWHIYLYMFVYSFKWFHILRPFLILTYYDSLKTRLLLVFYYVVFCVCVFSNQCPVARDLGYFPAAHFLMWFFFLRQGFTMKSRLTLNLWSSSLNLRSAGIMSVHHNIWPERNVSWTYYHNILELILSFLTLQRKKLKPRKKLGKFSFWVYNYCHQHKIYDVNLFFVYIPGFCFQCMANGKYESCLCFSHPPFFLNVLCCT
jgi:hypothetical protein